MLLPIAPSIDDDDDDDAFFDNRYIHSHSSSLSEFCVGQQDNEGEQVARPSVRHVSSELMAALSRAPLVIHLAPSLVAEIRSDQIGERAIE